ncbi:hypothetical protein O3677_08155 [Micrococcus luteus]|uniref:hypothetical protein n=1 Tax=Micrococcus TaxID=1269 RepID=UPI0004536A4A|nr:MULTISPECIES: hypothetical protein [Micrococcus]AYO50416.1 hypothetical protein FMM_08565 [Micrococcus luteus]EZP62262.1 hypothetical protein BW40_00398 [Micrococcus luteus]KIK90268.1 hypothetical protein OC70_00325 [Micrococcus luteus]KZE71809.1 hypothetical protein AWM60_03785 [Micrococcus aloeverae]MBO1029533.1 hypothetical protein [Micrococcus luteus]
MTTSRLPLLGALAVGALALAGCAGGGGAEPSSPAPSSASSTTTAASSAPTSPAASSSTESTGAAESTAGASASGSLSLEMPPALDGQRTLAVQAAVQRAAGPGSEVGLSAASPLERQTELRQRAAGLEQAVDAGASPASTRSAEQQACLDATRSDLERDAEAGAADLGLTAQPETAATTGGGPTTTPAPSFTASPDAEVTPLGVRVTVYPTEEAARAALEDARAAAQACTGVDLAGLDVESVTRTEHEGGTAYTALPAPGGSVYSHLTAVQDGARTVAVAQADADGGVPADAEDRAASIVADVLAALDGEG